MNKPRAIISIHDVTPAWAKEVIAAYEAISNWGIPTQPALFVIPNHHRRWPLGDYPEFVSQLKEWCCEGSEVFLHGYHHLAERRILPGTEPLAWIESKLLTSGEGEFLSLTKEETIARIKRGKQELEDILGCFVKGFVPPAWLRQPNLNEYLLEAGLTYLEGHLYIYDLENRKRFFAPAVTFTGRSRFRSLASVGFAKIVGACLGSSGAGSVTDRLGGTHFDIRLALHPVDFREKHLVDAIGEFVESISTRYQWDEYRSLLGDCR